MKRRTVLRNFAAGGVVGAAGGLPYGLSRLLAPDAGARPKRNYLRPPGALKDDAAFVAACIGCGLCGEVCPPRCIIFHTRDGGAKVNTPFIDPEQKACILCDKCMAACPTEALTAIPREDVDMGVARIDETACYPWVDRGLCGACVSICPLGTRGIAFQNWNQYRPYVKDGCVGCGICVEVCPHPSIPIWVVERPRRSAEKGAA